MNEKTTVKDVLEEMHDMTSSLCDDFAEMVPFKGKAVLLMLAINLHVKIFTLTRLLGAHGIDYHPDLEGIRDEEELPF